MSIVEDREALDLTAQQARQAEAQRESADDTVTGRLPETYQWLLVPEQKTPDAPLTWEAIRLSGQDALAVRAARRLRGAELLITSFGGTRLRMELDRVPLWRNGNDHVEVRQLVEDFARYLYLPRLADPTVLLQAVRDGVSLLSWATETFAFAESQDEATGRYRGLRGGQTLSLPDADAPGLLVRSEIARKQLVAESPTPAGTGAEESGTVASPASAGTVGEGSGPAAEQTAVPRRFHGSVELDATRVGRDAGRIADEVIAHLAGLVGAKVRVTLEIEAEHAEGVPENVVRTVTENSRTLKFTSHGFETE
jgi:hypothetical protein